MAGERIGKGHKKTFEQIQSAVEAGRIALMRCTDAKTGEFVTVLCAVNINGTDDGKMYEMVPLARLFNGNPYDEVNPPKS